ncbi:rhomboid family intramembrane serine protease [Porphyromonas sp.]
MDSKQLYRDYWQRGSIVLRLILLHTFAYLLIGLISWVCTLVAPLRWWNLGLYLSFYPEWDRLLSQPWSLLTYALPHLNLFHFLGNMCLLYVLLPVMEMRLGARHFLAAYVGGIIAGGVVYFLGYQLLGAQIIAPLSLQGASAALLSVFVSGVVYDRSVLSSFALRFIGKRVSPLLLGVLLLFIFLGASRGNAGGHLAHLGGLLFGIAYGYYCRSRRLGQGKAEAMDRATLLTQARHSGFASLSPAERRYLIQRTHFTPGKNEHPHD